ncbi:hypothetical protein VM1G_01473 [Cytospora mali]|uniref:SWI5-dependent HO expression protein 3 n=1 Tax=Cytospora mali TaxID=578113 RepID=A0A194VRA2_CYTMA|nr:hypothetical protein VM1G_01473 [Valsa mali]
MRKLMFSPKAGKSNKLTHQQEAPSPPRTAESAVSRLSIDDQPRSPRLSVSSTTSSMPANDLKPQPGTLPERPSSSLAPSAPNAMPRRMASIRPVSSFDDSLPLAVSSLEASPSLSIDRSNSVLSSSPNSNSSVTSPKESNGTEKMPRLRPKISAQYLANASNDVSPRSRSPGAPNLAGSPQIPQRESSIGGADRSAPKTNADGQEEAGFDNAVGKAALGKTGRVMNKLISENESLKRNLQIEKLNSEESRREAKLLQDKMERMVADYESRLLEANVTKTLLARKERQVEGLQAAVELEKKRTSDAQGKEQTGRDEMEKMREETTRKVEDATAQAALMEGRYNAISSHWKDQGEEVKRATVKMGKEIAHLVEERKKDDEKITTLRDLCDQQDGNIKELLQQKEAITQQFEAYKKEQDDLLRNIKANASDREASHQRMLDEAKETLDKLKWALNVKNKIEWAQ